jgi:hypothetical protein
MPRQTIELQYVSRLVTDSDLPSRRGPSMAIGHPSRFGSTPLRDTRRDTDFRNDHLTRGAFRGIAARQVQRFGYRTRATNAV